MSTTTTTTTTTTRDRGDRYGPIEWAQPSHFGKMRVDDHWTLYVLDIMMSTCGNRELFWLEHWHAWYGNRRSSIANGAFTLRRKSLDASSDLSVHMRPSVKALGHMCTDKVCVSGIIYIWYVHKCALTCVWVWTVPLRSTGTFLDTLCTFFNACRSTNRSTCG